MRTLLATLMFAMLIWALPVQAMPTPIFGPASEDLDAMGWRVLTFAGIPATRFEQQDDGAIAIEAMSSSAILFKRLPRDSEGHTLTWRWKVAKGLPPTDQDQKGSDDRPLAVHVWFDPLVETSGLLKTLVSNFGFDVPGRVLTYVWGGNGDTGDVLVNPHYEDEGRIIILRGGRPPENIWLTERVNLAADYRRAFGDEAPPPAYVAVSGDADDLHAMSQGLISDLTLLPD